MGKMKDMTLEAICQELIDWADDNEENHNWHANVCRQAAEIIKQQDLELDHCYREIDGGAG